MTETQSMATQALVHGFLSSYPDEAARALQRLPAEEILRLLADEPIPIAVEVFVRLNHDTAAALMPQMSPDLFRQLFGAIDPARGVALFARLDEPTRSERLALLPAPLAEEYGELMAYPPDSAGSLMDPRVTTCRIDDTAGAVLERLRTLPGRRIIDLCVVDESGCLEAVVPLQEVAIVEPTQPIGTLVRGQPVSIHTMAPRQDVVQLLEERRLASLPVVDLHGTLLGIIRYDALVAATKQAVSEDVQAMFGAGRDERALSTAFFAVRQRLPWLMINLGTAFLAAAVVGLFEETIARITALAIFLPVVAGQSGNTGSQALAVTMRGLALREIRPRHWPRVARKEVATGFINGCAIALSTSLIAYVWMGSTGLAVIIGVAMIFSMVIAGFSGAIIPAILRALGQDPAQASSIILTTVTDVVGFMSFLGLAAFLAEMLKLA